MVPPTFSNHHCHQVYWGSWFSWRRLLLDLPRATSRVLFSAKFWCGDWMSSFVMQGKYLTNHVVPNILNIELPMGTAVHGTLIFLNLRSRRDVTVLTGWHFTFVPPDWIIKLNWNDGDIKRTRTVVLESFERRVEGYGQRLLTCQELAGNKQSLKETWKRPGNHVRMKRLCHANIEHREILVLGFQIALKRNVPSDWELWYRV
jgi:hypothetical protein